MHVYVFVYVYVHMFLNVNVNVYAHVYVYMYVYVAVYDGHDISSITPPFCFVRSKTNVSQVGNPS